MSKVETLLDVTLWLRELESLQGAAVEFRGQMAELHGAQALALGTQNKRQEATIASNMGLLQKQSDAVEKVLFDMTGRLSLDSVNELVTDVRHASDRAREKFSLWRKLLSIMQWMDGLKMFDVPEGFELPAETRPTREEAQTSVDAGKREYEVALDQAMHLIPPRGGVALLS